MKQTRLCKNPVDWEISRTNSGLLKNLIEKHYESDRYSEKISQTDLWVAD